MRKVQSYYLVSVGVCLCLMPFTNKRTVVLNGMTGMIMKGNAMNVNGASGE